MNKKERKANEALKNAIEYVRRIQTQKLQPTPEPAKFEPQLYQGSRVYDYEIKKLQKGYFFLVVTANGQRMEVPKRFKSITKAKEWILKYI